MEQKLTALKNLLVGKVPMCKCFYYHLLLVIYWCLSMKSPWKKVAIFRLNPVNPSIFLLQAKQCTNGLEIDGRRIRVDYSITKRAHTPTPGVYMGKATQ